MRKPERSYRTASERLLGGNLTAGRKNNAGATYRCEGKFAPGTAESGRMAATARRNEPRRSVSGNKTAGPRLQGPPGEQLFIVNGNKDRHLGIKLLESADGFPNRCYHQS